MMNYPAQVKLNNFQSIIKVRYILSLWLLFLLWGMFLPIETLADQTVKTASGRQRKGTIKGQIINDGGQPFANAVVSAYPLSGVDNDERQIITDEDGSFQIKDLSATPYTITCHAPGYVEVKDDTSPHHYFIGDSVTLQLRKGGVITGMVTDTKGALVENAQVNVMRLRDAKDQPIRFAQSYDNVKTDDRGIYRFYGLQSGSYVVFVNKIGNFENEELREEIPIYFPSATRNTAQVVKVNVGEEVGGINIIYRNERGHSISGFFSGHVKKGESSSEVYIKLIHAKSGTIEVSTWQGYKTERIFAFHGVPDGEYYLFAQDDIEEANAASVPRYVTVKGGDVTGIELVLLPFASIEGRVVIDALPESQPKTLCKETPSSLIEEVTVKVSGNNGKVYKQLPAWLIENSGSAAPDEKGTFTLRSLASGQYQLGISFPNQDLYIRSINLRPATTTDRSRAQQNTIHLKTGERANGVVVTLARGAAQLQGRIALANESDKIPLRVYLVPSETEYADQDWRFAEADVQSDDTYTFKNLAPGHYRFVVRAAGKEEASEAIYPKISDAASRKILQREAESANLAVELQTCQQITNYLLPYPLPLAKTISPVEKKELQIEKSPSNAQTRDLQPATRKVKGTNKKTRKQ